MMTLKNKLYRITELSHNFFISRLFSVGNQLLSVDKSFNILFFLKNIYFREKSSARAVRTKYLNPTLGSRGLGRARFRSS